MLVLVEGNIGAGKSELVRVLAHTLREDHDRTVITLQEPVQEWADIGGAGNLLAAFYQDKSRWGLAFQQHALMTKLRLLDRHAAAVRDPHTIVVAERSVFTDYCVFAPMLHEQRHIDALSLALYRDAWGFYTGKGANVPSLFTLYLRTDPEVCRARITKRARVGEQAITLDYLQELHRRHEEWLGDAAKVITVDGNQDFQGDSWVQERIAKGFLHAIHVYSAEDTQ